MGTLILWLFVMPVLFAFYFSVPLCLAILGVGAYVLWRAPLPRIRGARLARNAALGGVFFFAGLLATGALFRAATLRFEAWHSEGAGLRAGMTAAEAETALRRRAELLEVDASTGSVRYVLRPKGAAADDVWSSFPFADSYYVVAAYDASGRLASAITSRD